MEKPNPPCKAWTREQWTQFFLSSAAWAQIQAWLLRRREFSRDQLEVSAPDGFRAHQAVALFIRDELDPEKLKEALLELNKNAR